MSSIYEQTTNHTMFNNYRKLNGKFQERKEYHVLFKGFG